jgi:transcriptional regulator with XRE-family HTH domain
MSLLRLTGRPARCGLAAELENVPSGGSLLQAVRDYVVLVITAGRHDREHRRRQQLAPAPPPVPRRAKICGVSGASPKTPLEALGALLHAQRTAADLSLRELATRTNVSNAYLSELERGLHEPSLRVLRAIAAALGMPLGSTLASAGVLGDAEGDRPADVRETEAAILRDAELSEPQRTALLSVYRSFVQTRTTR